jgi:hypothetical protein
LFSDLNEKYSRLDSKTPGNKLIDMPIDSISEEIDLMDRANELDQLLERERLSGEKKVRLSGKPSPLKIMKIYLKGSKGRPT